MTYMLLLNCALKLVEEIILRNTYILVRKTDTNKQVWISVIEVSTNHNKKNTIFMKDKYKFIIFCKERQPLMR